MFRRGDASAVVRVPKGFEDRLLDGGDAVVQLYKNPTQSSLPDVAESVLEMGATVANGIYSRAREPIARIKELTDEDREPTTAEVAAISVGFFLAGKRLGKLDGLSDLSVDVVRPGGGKSEGLARGPRPSEFFGTIFPGLVIFGILFISQALAFRLLRDRLQGLQRRLAVTPTSRGAILLGGLLYLWVALVVLLVVLGTIGVVVFRIELREPWRPARRARARGLRGRAPAHDRRPRKGRRRCAGPVEHRRDGASLLGNLHSGRSYPRS
jgi:hypothetical protein